jgi:hypothetical protein
LLPSVSEILSLPELASGEPRIVAGRRGLDNGVRWVHISELSDIATLLSGGELLLTTGIALPLEGGRAVAVCGEPSYGWRQRLVIELGRRFIDAPVELKEKAESLGLHIDILRAYLSSGRNKTQAESLLRLSRPALYDRVELIKSVLSLEIERVESSLSLQ